MNLGKLFHQSILNKTAGAAVTLASLFGTSEKADAQQYYYYQPAQPQVIVYVPVQSHPQPLRQSWPTQQQPQYNQYSRSQYGYNQNPYQNPPRYHQRSYNNQNPYQNPPRYHQRSYNNQNPYQRSYGYGGRSGYYNQYSRGQRAYPQNRSAQVLRDLNDIGRELRTLQRTGRSLGW